MAKRRRSPRFRLILYRAMIKRHRLPAFLLGFMLAILGVLTWFRWISWPEPPLDRWLLAGGIISLLYWFFTLIGPLLAYVQPRADHIRVQTPVYRINISYRRIRNTRPVDITKTFTQASTPRGFRRPIRQFYGATALGLDMRSWPLPRWFLALFLGRMMLAPDQPGLILIVDNWIELSKHIESMMGAWSDGQRQQLQHPGADVGEILRQDKKRRWWRK